MGVGRGAAVTNLEGPTSPLPLCESCQIVMLNSQQWDEMWSLPISGLKDRGHVCSLVQLGFCHTLFSKRNYLLRLCGTRITLLNSAICHPSEQARTNLPMFKFLLPLFFFLASFWEGASAHPLGLRPCLPSSP